MEETRTSKDTAPEHSPEKHKPKEEEMKRKHKEKEAEATETAEAGESNVDKKKHHHQHHKEKKEESEEKDAEKSATTIATTTTNSSSGKIKTKPKPKSKSKPKSKPKAKAKAKAKAKTEGEGEEEEKKKREVKISYDNWFDFIAGTSERDLRRQFKEGSALDKFEITPATDRKDVPEGCYSVKINGHNAGTFFVSTIANLREMAIRNKGDNDVSPLLIFDTATSLVQKKTFDTSS